MPRNTGVGIARAYLIAVRPARRRAFAAGRHQNALADLQLACAHAGVEALQAHQRHLGTPGKFAQGVAALDAHPFAAAAGVAVLCRGAGAAGEQPEQQRKRDDQARRLAASSQRSLSCQSALIHEWKRSFCCGSAW